jgi:hypothetical protein
MAILFQHPASFSTRLGRLLNFDLSAGFAANDLLGFVKSSGDSRVTMIGDGHVRCSGADDYTDNSWRFSQRPPSLDVGTYALTLVGSCWNSTPGWHDDGFQVLFARAGDGLVLDSVLIPAFTGTRTVLLTTTETQVSVVIGRSNWAFDFTYVQLN